MPSQGLESFLPDAAMPLSAPWQTAAAIEREVASPPTGHPDAGSERPLSLRARDEERRALARELHDRVIQELIGINYQLEAISNEGGNPAAGLQEVRENIGSVIDEIRRICSDLRPPCLENMDLAAAIRSYAGRWSARTGITVHLDLDHKPLDLPEAVELSLFQIVQEALNNVRKHTAASEVSIHLATTPPGSILISISDNGCGMRIHLDLSKLAAAGHFGLLGIMERVELLGGRLRVRNQSRSGLSLEVEIPYSPLRASILALTPTESGLHG